jgi:hypothetical protein
MMEAVKSGIEQLQRRRYLAAYSSILVSTLDRTQLARETGHSRGMVIAKPGSLAREAIFRRQARARAAGERNPAVDIGVVLRCWHSQLLDRLIGYIAGAFGPEIVCGQRQMSPSSLAAHQSRREPSVSNCTRRIMKHSLKVALACGTVAALCATGAANTFWTGGARDDAVSPQGCNVGRPGTRR